MAAASPSLPRPSGIGVDQPCEPLTDVNGVSGLGQEPAPQANLFGGKPLKDDYRHRHARAVIHDDSRTGDARRFNGCRPPAFPRACLEPEDGGANVRPGQGEQVANHLSLGTRVRLVKGGDERGIRGDGGQAGVHATTSSDPPLHRARVHARGARGDTHVASRTHAIDELAHDLGGERRWSTATLESDPRVRTRVALAAAVHLDRCLDETIAEPRGAIIALVRGSQSRPTGSATCVTRTHRLGGAVQAGGVTGQVSSAGGIVDDCPGSNAFLHADNLTLVATWPRGSPPPQPSPSDAIVGPATESHMSDNGMVSDVWRAECD